MTTSINKNACGTCIHFDQKFKIVKGEQVKLKYGWCAAHSLYPTKEQPGHVFPDGVERIEEGKFPKLKIVQPGKVENNCTKYSKK